jgi:TPP-dependent pyruvate/acetoin dehydrogenase alpha subunit
MEYNWTTSAFIAASKSFAEIALMGVGPVLLGYVVWRLLPTSKTETQRRNEEELYERDDGNPIESSQNDANQLLRQIESNTAKTAFWTRVVGVPVLIGLIIGALASMAQCS